MTRRSRDEVGEAALTKRWTVIVCGSAQRHAYPEFTRVLGNVVRMQAMQAEAGRNQAKALQSPETSAMMRDWNVRGDGASRYNAAAPPN